MFPRVAIIYLSYNSRPYLDEVVSSVAALDYPKDRLEFIIVDNNSPDKSADVIRETVVPKSGRELPRVTFFPSGENLGFSAGCNLGIEYVLLETGVPTFPASPPFPRGETGGLPTLGVADGIDYIFLLNNDAKFHPRAIKEAVVLAESDQMIGSVQSLMLLWQKPDTINSTGGMVHFLGFGFVRDNGRKFPPLPDQRSPEALAKGEGGRGGEGVWPQRLNGEEIAYASGAAVLYRASTLRKVGLLDPFYFMYHEDLELGWRMRLAGFKNVLALKSVVYHHYEFKRSVQKFFWMERNRVLVHVAHLKLPTLLLLAPFMLLLEVALLAFSFKGGWSPRQLTGGWTREKLLVYAEFFRPAVWWHVINKRRESRMIRQVSDSEIVRLFTSQIKHQETANPVVDYIGNPILAVVWWVLKRVIVW